MEHRFSLVAKPPPELGESLDVRGAFRQAGKGSSAHVSIADVSGQLYARVEDLRPLGWSPCLDLPQNMKFGQVFAQSWLTFGAGEIQHITSDVGVSHG